jgi:hypothetical protein
VNLVRKAMLKLIDQDEEDFFVRRLATLESWFLHELCFLLYTYTYNIFI